MTLKADLVEFSKSLGVDLFGVADLSSANEFILAQGGKIIAEYPQGISIGIRLVDGVVEELCRHEDPVALYGYAGMYNAVNSSLDRASLMIAKRIQEKGYKAYPVPSSQTTDRRKMEAAISHKLVANLAGLGWIGKNCLLITKYGPRVRLTTILTDAPLEAGSPTEGGCGDCRSCVDACPAGAFTGVSFDSRDDRSVRFRASLCTDYTGKREKQFGTGTCGLCVYACPIGKPAS